MNNRLRAEAAAAHIQLCFPQLAHLIRSVGPIMLPTPEAVPLAVAVTDIIAGQMLSGAVAKIISSRITEKMREMGVPYSWMLTENQLFKCGLSGRKAKAIKAFGKVYTNDAQSLENWASLNYTQLVPAVKSVWGLGEWSASMLAIFHFGHEDVYPQNDGSIRRALIQLFPNAALQEIEKFDAAEVKPFRSFFALYLWAALDTNYFVTTNVKQI